MTQLLEYIKMALSNIRANKGRSVLTMLGIIIGISSVITIMAVGDGFKKEMGDQFNSMIGGQLAIYMGDEAYNNEDYMNADDLDAVEELEGVTGTSPFCNDYGTAIVPKGEFSVNLSGGGTGAQEVSMLNVKEGRFFNKSDISTGNRVCTIKKEDAVKAFGTDDVLGMNIEVTLYQVTLDLTIIGITEDKNAGNSGVIASMMGSGYNMEKSISLDIPYTLFESFGWETSDNIYGFYITTDGQTPTDQISDEAVKLLKQRHHVSQEDYYMMEDADAQIKTIESSMGMVTAFISLVAAISLLVGGIGVMNIMLVSVTERTREIGIRKALGAKTGSIMLQFLAESAIIAGIGGLIGIILGTVLAYTICSLPMLNFTPGIKVSTILLATLFSSGVGIFFGIYPAKKAAKMSPTEALRRE